ncbi:uncharacterized protein MELLADRAFT_113530 [Melampsora larici-populina 98AG31]|uniref:Uncharacterized protein n=1 Tax=Melampsora larici-populina (strain 98AG31 / pathotype 3-4-7) TaxID=747676 RepID=F4SA74_MELLP|nr:uncharacterized protein MELLADRAFT_113530 [Melampsora larici-populina 98AG31]EGF98404.1 hypothetical protein MELLADRAFT_113530 [Melampsora larici-populina 98AG31]
MSATNYAEHPVSPLSDPQFLNVLNSHFLQYIEPSKLFIFETGVTTRMHLWHNYAFRIRDFGSPRASSLVFTLQPAPDIPDPDRYIVAVLNLDQQKSPHETVFMVITQTIISKTSIEITPLAKVA